MKETCSRFVLLFVRSSISGEAWVEAIQSYTVQCGCWWTVVFCSLGGSHQTQHAHKCCQICHIPQQGSLDKTCIWK